MFRITSNSRDRTSSVLQKLRDGNLYVDLNRYGEMGVKALSAATPVDSSLTANSWGYRVIKKGRHIGIEWFNTNVVDGVPVAIILEYGHATGTGGYVSGKNFINPVIQPIFDEISDAVWKKVRL